MIKKLTQIFIDSFPPYKSPILLNSVTNAFVEESKPQYENVEIDKVLSIEEDGTVFGDGTTDDTIAFQLQLNKIVDSSDYELVLIDHGVYIITNTITVPINSRIVGECWPLILASGDNFKDPNHPIPLF
jgi:glucan 1,3-beta-glucosidase